MRPHGAGDPTEAELFDLSRAAASIGKMRRLVADSPKGRLWDLAGGKLSLDPAFVLISRAGRIWQLVRSRHRSSAPKMSVDRV